MFELPLQVATEREIARQQYSLAGQPALADWTVRLKDFPHPALSTSSLVGQVIGPFLFAASMFSYVPVVTPSSHAAFHIYAAKSDTSHECVHTRLMMPWQTDVSQERESVQFL